MDGALQALTHPTRASILRAVCRREQTVGELAKTFKLRQPAASQHLQVLRRANLVSVRTDANRRWYRANHKELGKLRRYLEGFWEDSLPGLKAAAEARE